MQAAYFYAIANFDPSMTVTIFNQKQDIDSKRALLSYLNMILFDSNVFYKLKYSINF